MLHALGLLRALGHPVIDAAEIELQADLVLHGLRVVETHLLEALATLTLAAVGHDDVKERRVGSPAAGQTNCHHVIEPLTAVAPGRNCPTRPAKKERGFYANQWFGGSRKWGRLAIRGNGARLPARPPESRGYTSLFRPGKSGRHLALECAHQSLELPAREALHHLLHFHELLHQLVHVLHLDAGAGSDAAAARTIQQPRIATLFFGHRVDDRDLAAHVLVALLRRRCARLHGRRRQLVHERRHAAHLLQL